MKSRPWPRKKLAEFCHSKGIKWLAACDGDIPSRQYPGVDLVLLAEFEKDCKVSYFDLFDVERELTDLYGVLRVSMVTPSGLRGRKEEFLSSAQVQFAAW